MAGKTIVLLADGTGNSAAKLFKSNVWRLYKALDLSDPPRDGKQRQIAYYHDGVGTSSFKPLTISIWSSCWAPVATRRCANWFGCICA